MEHDTFLVFIIFIYFFFFAVELTKITEKCFKSLTGPVPRCVRENAYLTLTPGVYNIVTRARAEISCKKFKYYNYRRSRAG